MIVENNGSAKYAAANGWWVLNNDWGVGNWVYGVDYTISSKFDNSNIAQGTVLKWDIPALVGWPVIRAYPEINVGSSPYGGDITKGSLHVFPLKVDDIDHLTANYDVDYAGYTDGFNVAYDIWFTSVANGTEKQITNELMIWLHKGDDVSTYGKNIGTYTDETFSGTIYHTGTYTAIVSDTDLNVGSVDIHAMIANLQARGIISSEEYIAGVQLGAEVVTGEGSLTINNLDVDVVGTTIKGEDVSINLNGHGGDVFSDAYNLSNTNDFYYGTIGHDVIFGNGGDDVIHGQEDDDVIKGGTGNDMMDGGSGGDTIYGDDGDDYLFGREGNDTIHGGNGNDLIMGGEGNDVLYGEEGNDVFAGNEGNDIIYGGLGNDDIHGCGGEDRIYGGAGNDTIYTSLGKDELFGDMGADIFVFTKEGLDGVDKIYFNGAEGDKLNLSGILDHAGLNGTLNGDILHFVTTKVKGADTVISIDANGATGGVKFIDVAILANIHEDMAHLISQNSLIV